MMGQIQAASNAALDFPTSYDDLYAFLTRKPGDTGSNEDAQRWREFCEKVERNAEITAEDERVATRARARIDHFVQRKLDAFQTQTEYRWAWWNQLVSVGGAALIIIGLLVANDAFTPERGLLALFGGLLAPVAKDVVTALTGLRARRGV